MLAIFSVTPVGTGEEMKELLAKTAKILDSSGLDYQLTSMGMIVEGDWDEVLAIVKKCHDEICALADRVVTNIMVDDRAELKNRLKNNVLEIEYAVGDSLETHGLT